MDDCKGLKRFFNQRIIAMITACGAMMVAGGLCAATLHLGTPSVILRSGQTIEVPLYSSKPISGDLTARGRFQSGDVSFTPSPSCHLTAHACSLLITAAPSSQDYTAVPVVVSESGASNKPVFFLSVIRPGRAAPVKTKLPEIISTPLVLSHEIGSRATLTFTNTTDATLYNLTADQLPVGVGSSICPLVAPGVTCTLGLVVNDVAEAGDSVMSIRSDQGVVQDRILSISGPPKIAQKPLAILSPKPGIILTAGNLTASIISHTIGSAYYTSRSNGPVYQMVEVTNNGSSSVSLDVPVISGTDASVFSIDTNSADYAGTPILCSNAPTLAVGERCEIIITSIRGDPSTAPVHATLTMSDGESSDTLTFDLIDTTYVYAAGGFNTLGATSVSEGALLAQCTNGICSNALQGTTGNYASKDSGVGQWINALAITPTGNLMVGGVFGAIGGATSGSTGISAALLAQCTPGPVSGNACINQISSANPYAFNNAYIDAITVNSGNNAIYLGGDFAQIRSSSVSSGKMLAKCTYSGTSPTSNCSNYFTGGSSKSANAAISAVTSLGSDLNVGGLFTQIAGYPTPPPSSGTTFASCTTSTCSQDMGVNNPNGSILGMTNGGTDLYMGGTFTQIGTYNDISGGYPLVKCTLASTTTCENALAGSGANGYIEGLVYSEGLLYVGGNFTTIGGAAPVDNGNMLAVCTPIEACSNVVTGTNPYATGGNWRGGIFAIAVGNQTTIVAN